MAAQEKKKVRLARTSRTLPIALLRAREAVMDRFRPLLHQHDITEQQWRVIRVLQETGPIDATQLASEATLLAPSLTRMLKALAARGFITQEQDKDDRRRSLIALTDAGAAFIEKLAPESATIYARMENEIGAERIDALLNDLSDLLAALDRTEN